MSAPENPKDDDTPPEPDDHEHEGHEHERHEHDDHEREGHEHDEHEQDQERERRSPRLREPKHHRVVRPGAQFRRRAITAAGLMLLIVAALGVYTAAGVLSQVGAN